MARTIRIKWLDQIIKRIPKKNNVKPLNIIGIGIAVKNNHQDCSIIILFNSIINLLFLVMSDHNFFLSDQDGVLVGHMSFRVKKIICSPGPMC